MRTAPSELCETNCELFKNCKNPFITPVVDMRLGTKDENLILVLGDYTDKKDDSEGGYFASKFRGYHIIEGILPNLECRYVFTTALACGINDKDIKPAQMKKYMKACFEVKLKPLILKYKPKAIICLGKQAMDALLQEKAPKTLKTITQTGMAVEFYEEHHEILNCLVVGLNHPAQFLKPDRVDVAKLEATYKMVFGKAEDFCRNSDKRLPVEFELIDTPAKLFSLAHNVSIKKFAFDIENTYAEKDVYKNTMWKCNSKILSLSVTYKDQKKGELKTKVIVGKALEDKFLIETLFRGRHVIAHNCLTADSLVTLADGSRQTIQSMVVHKHPGPVMCVNEVTGALEIKPVVGWIKNPARQWDDWLRINTTGANLLSITKDHEVLTTRGRVQAKDIVIGDKIITPIENWSSAKKALIVGSWMGDASAIKAGRAKNFIFRVSHGEKQHDYVDFKAEVLGDLVSSVVTKPSSSRGFSKNTVLKQLATKVSPIFNEIYASCPNRKELLTEEKLKWLEDPRVLAIWFLDDGSKQENCRRISICVSAYKKVGPELLVNKLNSLGYTSYLYTRPDGHIYITITGEGSDRFISDIAPFVPTCMNYKIPENLRHLYSIDNWKSEEKLELWADEVVSIKPLLKEPGSSRYSGRSASSERGIGPKQFCLEVQDNHNFFAGGLLVSNCAHDVQGIYRLCGVDIWPLVSDYDDTMAKFYLSDQNRLQNDLKNLSAQYLGIYDYADDVKRYVIDANNRIALLRKQIVANAKEKIKHLKWYQEAIQWRDQGVKFSSAKRKNLQMVLDRYESQDELIQLLKLCQEQVEDLPPEGSADYGDIPISVLAAYNAEDTVCTYRLNEEILPFLSKYDPSFGRQDPLWSDNAYLLYKRAVRMSTYVSRNGLPIDIESLNEMGDKLAEKEKEVRTLLLERPEVIKAIEQLEDIQKRKEKGTLTQARMLAEVSPTKKKFMDNLCYGLKLGRFAKETKKGGVSFTAKAVVEKIAKHYEEKGDEYMARLFKDFVYIGNNRQVRSKFIKNWNKYYVPEDKCFHPVFKLMKNQSTLYANKDADGGAGSGRISTSLPNTAQIRKVAYLRKHFKARPGYKFVEIDYAQLEVYIIAWLSGCETLKEVFRKGYDIYCTTANEIFYKGTDKYIEIDPTLPAKEVNDRLKEAMGPLRDKMKVAFLAWAYGRSKPSFARDLNLTEKETDDFYENAEKIYHEIFTWKQGIIQDIKDGNPITTPFGRFKTAPIRPPEKGNWEDQKRYRKELAKIIRSVVNFPPQGTGSDICLWMACIIQEWILTECYQDVIKLVNLVHDAIWFEIKETQLDWAIAKLQGFMEDVSALPFNFDIPLRTEASQGYRLSDYIKNKEMELEYV